MDSSSAKGLQTCFSSIIPISLYSGHFPPNQYAFDFQSLKKTIFVTCTRTPTTLACHGPFTTFQSKSIIFTQNQHNYIFRKT